MDYHRFCRRVIISGVIVDRGETNRVRDVHYERNTYILMACSKYPPPPEVVITGWVRPGSTYGCDS